MARRRERWHCRARRCHTCGNVSARPLPPPLPSPSPLPSQSSPPPRNILLGSIASPMINGGARFSFFNPKCQIHEFRFSAATPRPALLTPLSFFLTPLPLLPHSSFPSSSRSSPPLLPHSPLFPFLFLTPPPPSTLLASTLLASPPSPPPPNHSPPFLHLIPFPLLSSPLSEVHRKHVTSHFTSVCVSANMMPKQTSAC